MIPTIIHQIWLGGEIPERNRGFVEGVKRLHPDWEHIMWNEDSLADIGIDVAGMKEKLGSWASVSNMVRLIVVSLYGGIYLDVDMECLRPLDPFTVFGAVASYQDMLECGDVKGRICNAFFGAEAHHYWVDWQIKNSPRFASRDAVWGVYLMSQAPRDNLTIIPTTMVYPFSWDSPPEARQAAPESFLVHWWDKRW